MNIELSKNLSHRIQNSIDMATEYETTLANYEMADVTGQLPPGLESEIWEAAEPFQNYMSSIFRDLKSLTDLLALHSLAEELKDKATPYKDNLAKIEYSHEKFDMHSPFLQYCKRVFASISAMLNADVSSGLDTFKSILENTPMILKDSKVIPTNETHVSREVFKILEYAFPDAIRPSIPQFTKTYRPDLGVSGLRAAAEYKFITKIEDLKTAIGGIYEDIYGYSGSADWEIFYSVFYISCPIPPVKVILSEFEKTNVPKNWHHIFVYGPNSKT